MSKITTDRLLPFLAKQTQNDFIRKLIIEIITLEDKLNNVETQSWYFQKGEANHRLRLKRLKSEYKKMMEIININEPDFFIGKITDNEKTIQEMNAKNYLGFINRFCLANATSDLYFYKTLLEYKNKFHVVKSFEEIKKDETFLKMIFE